MFVFGVGNDSQLSRVANINRQTIASWRRRDSIPYAECINIAIEKELSLDWLLMGEGEIYRTAEAKMVAYTSKSSHILQVSENKNASYQLGFSLTAKERNLLDLINNLSDSEQLNIQMVLEEKKRLSSMEQQLERLTLELKRIKNR